MPHLSRPHLSRATALPALAAATLLAVAPTPVAAQSLGGCPMFPSDNIWNVPIDDLPVHAMSNTWITFMGGAALHLAGKKVKAKMAKFAAALLEAHEEDLVFENGTVHVKGAPAVSVPFQAVSAYATCRCRSRTASRSRG